jgi:asparagine synthase (glutamine-hydrolysing)
MCGIAGFVSTQDKTEFENIEHIGLKMVNALAHRGPNCESVWSNSKNIILAHRRLAVLDLSPAGYQPMMDRVGRYVIVFNGEIYNHLDLRNHLQAEGLDIGWRGHSDTETLLECIQAWGLEGALKKIIGMFAFAVWDKKERSLTLARDRFGEKPIYYGWNNDNFLFGSELKALVAHPEWSGEVDRNALSLYLRYGYVPTPYSIWRGIKKLLPGSYVVLTCAENTEAILSEPFIYWEARSFIERGMTEHLSDAQAIETLDQLLHQSIKGQVLADVPLGAFLSGGIDSSTVVAVMQAEASRPVQTFTLGFAEKDYDEAVHAKAVARHLQTDHTEMYVTASDAMALIPKLPDMYDEPFADASQLPTHLVALLASGQVTVSLSGDGGDELFGGYNRHLVGPKLWDILRRIPLNVRCMLGEGIKKISPASWDAFGCLLPTALKQPLLGDKAHKLANLFSVSSAEDIYRWLVSVERNPEVLLLDSADRLSTLATWAETEAAQLICKNPAERMMFNDVIGYLTDDILCKVDRAAMATSLEVRVPFLDHRVAEFAFGLPHHMKIRDGLGKWLVRQVLSRYVPQALIDRPKQGFAVPLDSWLRGPLREWAEGLLAPERLEKEHFFNVARVTERWREHLSGRKNWQYWLWNILMFQSWQEKWLTPTYPKICIKGVCK